MKNKDYLHLWDKHSDIHKFNLDGVYSLMFVEDGETIDNVLDYVHIDKDKLINSDNKKVNKSLGKMDDMMLEVSEFMRVFIVDNLFDEVSDETFMNEYQQLKCEIQNVYSKFEDEIVTIRTELDKTQ